MNGARAREAPGHADFDRYLEATRTTLRIEAGRNAMLCARCLVWRVIAGYSTRWFGMAAGIAATSLFAGAFWYGEVAIRKVTAHGVDAGDCWPGD